MITIYSKDACSYCFMAKKLCETKNIPHQIKQLDIDYTREDLLNLTEGKARTFPQIFNDGELIGGFTEFQKLVASGKI
jgi:glutaredoxin 1